jgi:glycosyltransferase involved in cell wall biosynthesis
LAVVISTYNRADFVSMNAAWVLRLIERENLPVVCVVVDNVSTDDTHKKLSRFFHHPNFRYICNPQNVGMLGNLQVCSCLSSSRHVWITGDDDFVVPGALTRTLAVLRNHPSIPFVFHNFAVYHREKVSHSDSAARFVRSGKPVGTDCSESGIRPVHEIAGQHDNLFTAIYPIVFRSDIASACFNYPFQGVPFSNLVESVPTTDIILGTYCSVHAQWFKEVGIVGNAHNSWSGHRPRWHLVLMAEVLAKARDAGVDPKKLWKWLQVHRGLFKDAADIAIAKKVTAHICPDELEMAHVMFRERIALPAGLQVRCDGA